MDIVIFNVEMGQCIFLYPRMQPEYALMIDCGNRPGFEPVDHLIRLNLLQKSNGNGQFLLPNLTLTNYDQDHFGGLPYLRSKVDIKSIWFARNLTTDELKNCKPSVTYALTHVCELLTRYTSTVKNWNPPYTKTSFALQKAHFPNGTHDTNRLSQLVFITYKNTTICVPGDLDSCAWMKHLEDPNVQNLLRRTDIFIASHHGREDGFCQLIFEYCSPECIILSDKHMCHGTQDGMCGVYRSKIRGNGFILDDDVGKLRRTLTTRCDGHIWIRVEDTGARRYRTLDLN